LERYDKCAVDEIAQKLSKEHYGFTTLITAVVKSTPFQMHRGDDKRTEAAPTATPVAVPGQ
jgi:hypothetical protein